MATTKKETLPPETPLQRIRTMLGEAQREMNHGVPENRAAWLNRYLTLREVVRILTPLPVPGRKRRTQ